MTGPPLTVRDLTAFLDGAGGPRRVLDGVALCLRKGRAFALLGESGSGKTCLLHSLLGIHPGVPGVVAGEAEILGVPAFQGLQHLVDFSDDPALRIRKDTAAWSRGVRRNLSSVFGSRVTLVPQDPATTLSPFHTVGQLLESSLARARPRVCGAEAQKAALEWLRRVHVYGGRDVARLYVHELSGGMAQRVALALALAPSPELVAADEPTTGLDATLKARILQLLSAAVESQGVTLFLITHDIEAARLLADDVAVLCAGRIVEVGPCREVLDPRAAPKHPYTSYLLESELRLAGGGIGADLRDEGSGLVSPLAGDIEAGCVFRRRCPTPSKRCAAERPPMTAAGPDHGVSCFQVPR